MISLKACLEGPIRPPRSKDDLGVKKRVKDLGVIVGGLRGLLLCWLPRTGSIGEEAGSSPSSDIAVLGAKFSCDPIGVSSAISVVYRPMDR